MMRLHGYKPEWLEVLKKQDELFRVESFSADDALALGLIMVRLAKEVYKSPMAFKVITQGQVTFAYLMEGTDTNNEWWMSKKLNTCRLTGESSIRSLIEVGEGLRAKEPEFDVVNNYALCGGCLPLRNAEGKVMAYVLSSGMPHFKDHQLAADAICEYLHISAPRLEGEVED